MNERNRRAGSNPYETVEVCTEEKRLLETLRANPWGEATVVMKAGKPVMVKGIREDVKLTD
jgi:hypothetical protein